MKYNNIQSLEHIALVKISFKLWNQDDTRALMAKVKFGLDPSRKKTEWQKIEDTVMEKVPQLPLPMSLKGKVLCFIKPVGIELLKWMENCSENGYLCIKLLNEIFWTPQGTIDKKKMIETFINNENNDIIIRHTMATIFYMTDDVKKLKNNLPEDYQKSLNSSEQKRKEQADKIKNFLNRRIYITGRAQRGLNPWSFNQINLNLAAEEGRRGAVEYLLQKLSSREKEESLQEIVEKVARNWERSPGDFPTKPHTDILAFLFSQMNEQQQKMVFQSHPYKVLESLLYWPWQSFFTETVSCMQKHLPQNSLYLILKMISDKVENGYKDYNYQQLFGEFWQQSFHAEKRNVIESGKVLNLLESLFHNKDKRNIELIFKDLTPRDKRTMVSSRFGICVCEYMIHCEEWDLLTFYIQESILSKDEMVHFKRVFQFKKNVIGSSYIDDVEKVKWDKFFHLLDDFICGYDKRKCTEDEESNLAKKHSNTRSINSGNLRES